MQAIDAFELRPIPGELPRSELLWRERPVGLTVDGVILEKQFRVAVGFLLLLTENCPYEEGLHIYLLDPEYRLLDTLELSAPHAAGIPSDVQPQDAWTLTFTFFGDERWRLTIRDQPSMGLNLPLLSPVKRKTRLWARRWLALQALS